MAANLAELSCSFSRIEPWGHLTLVHFLNLPSIFRGEWLGGDGYEVDRRHLREFYRKKREFREQCENTVKLEGHVLRTFVTW